MNRMGEELNLGSWLAGYQLDVLSENGREGK